jgi:hypothetical protein
MTSGPPHCCCRKKKCKQRRQRREQVMAYANAVEVVTRRYKALAEQSKINKGAKGTTKSWMVASRLESAAAMDLESFVDEAELRAARASVALQMDVNSTAPGKGGKAPSG